jgi:nucleotide sugar dehydrogenase
MRVSVIGAGKMGLPLACQLAANGAKVVACDANLDTVEKIQRGICPFDEPGVPELLAKVVADGALTASTDTVASIRNSDVVIVIVPVLLDSDHRADLGIIQSVTHQIAEAMHSGLLVVYETTLPVGTTRGFASALGGEKFKVGHDFHLVFSPERVKSKLVLKHLTQTPKIVGGFCDACTKPGVEFYQTYLQAPVLDVGSLEAAEMAKLAGMVYRDVNIALANELARYCDLLGLDFETIRNASNTDGEAYLLSPGIGVGGHCTPVYPYFYIHDAVAKGVSSSLAMEGRRINDEQAELAVQRIEQSIGSLRAVSVTILGLGFRPGVKEHTCSSAFLIQRSLQNRQAEIRLVDPLYSDDEIRSHGFEPGTMESKVLILNTAHPEFLALDFRHLKSLGVELVMDGRNAWDRAVVTSAGIQYLGIGRSV